MLYVTKDIRASLDPIVDNLINKLREMESDYDTGYLEERVAYVVSQVLARVCGEKDNEITMGLGMLEVIKADFINQVVTPALKQEAWDNEL